MKVRPSHLPCITVSCVNIAIEEFAAENNVKRNVSIEELGKEAEDDDDK